MKTAYYQNKQVSVLNDLGDGRFLIAIPYYVDLSSHYEREFGEGEVEVVVYKEDLRDRQIDVDVEFLKFEKKSDSIIREAQLEAQRIKKESTRALEKDLASLKAKVEAYEGAEEVLRFMDSEYKYVITEYYGRYAIRDIYKEEMSEGRYNAIVLRGSPSRPLVSFLNSRYNGGGDSYAIVGYYKTYEDAQADLKPIIESAIKAGKWSADDYYGITSDIIEQYKAKQRQSKEDYIKRNIQKTQEQITKHEQELAKLREGLSNDAH